MLYFIPTIIELDGGQHAEEINMQKDSQRTAYLQQKGYHVLRFWDNEVLNNMDAVLRQIFDWLDGTPSPQPSPSGEGEGVKRDEYDPQNGR